MSAFKIPPFAAMPPEVRAHIDVTLECAAVTIYGNCRNPVLRNEYLCLEHSTSSRARQLRQQYLNRMRKELKSSVQLRAITRRDPDSDSTYQSVDQPPAPAWADEQGRVWSQEQELMLARQRTSTAAAGERALLEAAGQIALPLPPTAAERRREFEESEKLADLAPDERARELGEMAMRLVALEDLNQLHQVEGEIVKQKACFAMREVFDERNEQRAEARDIRREQREEERRLTRRAEMADQPKPYRIRFQGDPTTPTGMTLALDGLARLYADGFISNKRFDNLLSAFGALRRARRDGCTRPLRYLQEEGLDPGEGSVIVADTRDYKTRRSELQAALATTGSPSKARLSDREEADEVAQIDIPENEKKPDDFVTP